VTDYDCWHEGSDVDVTNIMAVMHGNATLARAAIKALCAALPATREPSPIDTLLDAAIMTAPEVRDPALLVKNAAILARWLAKGRTA
jgi:5'-methylthioadenosine phosphorylase